MSPYIGRKYAPKVGALAHTSQSYIVAQGIDGIRAVLDMHNIAVLYGLAVGVFHNYPLIVIVRGFMGAITNIVICALTLRNNNNAAVFV
jgi:hypothetical protein